MSELLLYTYIGLNIFIAFKYYNKDNGVFQLPFLVACVSLTFVTPQLFGVYINDLIFRPLMGFPLFIFVTCNIGIFLGFRIGCNKNILSYYELKIRGLLPLIIIFFVIGLMAYIFNRGTYKGGFVSGVYVIFNFFTQYLTYALILAICLLEIGYKDLSQTKRKVIYFILIIITCINCDRFLLQARRAEAIQFVLIISYFALNRFNKIGSKWRLIIPLFFLIGMGSGSQIGKYRENAYSGNVSIVENLSNITIDFSDAFLGNPEGEIKNAMLGINNVFIYGEYDFGAFNWNNIISNYIPKAIFGDEIKRQLLIDTGNNQLVSTLTKSGSTMTGYYDSYKSFGIFAFLKFLIIGFILGVYWKRSTLSRFYLLPYFGCLTAALHILTHSSGNFVTALLFWWLFINPFLNKNKEYLND